jgi:hypothetical protein
MIVKLQKSEAKAHGGCRASEKETVTDEQQGQ